MTKLYEFEAESLDYEVITEQEALDARERIRRIIENIETVITGKREQVELVTLCLLAEGHVLIEDLPGTGKTSLVSALARTIDCGYSRIQFTPDVMPSDVSGFSIFNQKTGEFEFRKGAAMSNIVLADEINRASAKTQSAMLEIMEERQVTVDSHTYKMESPFMVLATQNPIDSLGTYQLPEAQIDRFMIKMSMGYPTLDNEIDIVLKGKRNKSRITYVTDGPGVETLIRQAEHVYVDRQIASYIVHLTTATRSHPDVRIGSSPRGSIALLGLARAYALYQGRNYVEPEDVRYLAPYALSHRIILNHAAKTAKKESSMVVQDVLRSVAVPVEGEGRLQRR